MSLQSCKTELTTGMQKLALIVLSLSIGLSACGLPSKKPRADLTEEAIFRDLVSDPAFRDGRTSPGPVLLAIQRFAEDLEELESGMWEKTFIDYATELQGKVAIASEVLDSSSTCALPTDTSHGARKICTLSKGPIHRIYLQSFSSDAYKSKVYIEYPEGGGKIVEFSFNRLSFKTLPPPPRLPERVFPDLLPDEHQDRLYKGRQTMRL